MRWRLVTRTGALLGAFAWLAPIAAASFVPTAPAWLVPTAPAWLVPTAAGWLVPAAAAGVEALPAPEASPPGGPAPPPHRDAVPQGPSVDERLFEIARRIERALRYPPIARERGATGEALVAFEIRADGTPERVELARTSGSGALDRAALRAVADAAPLPFVYGRIHVPVRFALEPAE